MMINPTEREIYLFNKLTEGNWYTIDENDHMVLKDNVPEKIRKEDQELRDIHKKNNPARWVW